MPIDPQAEILRLRTALRDLVALSTIPAAWVGREPPDIAAGLADVLVGSLHLDFAFVRLCDPNGGAAVEVTRGNAWKSFPAWLQDHLAPVGQFSRREIIPDVGGAAEPCRGVVIPIGVNAEGGLVAVACDRTDFPTEIDQLLLSVAANHAATAFQNARLIHERKRAEEELRQARDELEMKVVERTAELRRATAELETILDASPVGIALFGRDQTVQRSNPAFERILGWTADEIAGRPIPVPAANQEEWNALAERLNRGEAFASVETRLLRKDGSEFDAAVACAPLEDERARPLGFVGTIEDISDRKHAEEALRRSEAYLAEAQRLSYTGSWALNVATRELVHWSRELYRMHGLDPERGLPSFEAVIQRIHPEDRARALEILERAIREKTDFEVDLRTVLPNGEMKYFHGVGHPVFNASGDVVEFVGTAMDVTERKRAEEERERLLARERAARAEAVAAQHRFRDLVNSVDGIVWEADAETFVFSFVNEQAERILGYPIEQWLNEPTFWKDHLHPDDRDWAIDFRLKATARNRNHDFEYRMIAADRRIIWLRDLVTVVVEGARVTKLRGVMVDITKRKRAEETLREQANLLNLTHDSVFVRDMNDIITYWNRGAEELYGWTREEAVGKVSHQLTQTTFPAPLEEINAELLGTSRWEGELIRTKRDGTQVVVASRWSLQRDEQGQPVATLETNNNITERKRAETDLRDRERRYRSIFQGAGVSIWEEDFSQVKAAIDDLKAQGVRNFRQYTAEHPEFVRQAISMVKVIDVNDATVRLFGAQSKDELLVSLEKIFLPGTEEVFAGELIAVAEGRTSFESETVVRTLKGDKLTVLFTITFPPQPAKFDSVLVSIMDITERKRAEYLTGQVFETSPDLESIIGRDYRYQRVNPVFEKIWGIPAERMVGMHVADLWGVEVFEQKMKPNLDRCFAGEDVRFGEWFDIPSGRRYQAVSFSPLWPTSELVEAVLVIGRDLTEYMLASEALRENQQLLQAIFDNSSIGVYVKDLDGRYMLVNRRFEEAIGRRSEEILGKTAFDIFPEETAQQYQEFDRMVLEAGATLETEQVDLFTGSPCWTLKIKCPLFDSSGEPYATCGISTDITQLKKAEFELLRLNRALRVLNACGQAVAYSGDEQSLLEQVCRAIVETAGYRLAWIGYAERDAARTVRPVAHAGRDSDYVEALDITWADEGRGRGLTGTAIRKGLPIVCKDTTTDPGFLPWREVASRYGFKSSAALPLLIEGSPLGALIVHSTDPDAFDEKEVNLLQQAANDVAHGVMVFRARSDRARAEESLRRTQTELAHVARVMTMGELASSIAHEVNQPLAAVTTNGNACLRWLAGEPPNLDEARESLRRIVRDGKRAGEVIARIRSLVKRSAPAKERLDLNETIREVLVMINSEARRHRVSVLTELAASLPPVRGDRVQLQQVILNLVVNGIEAMKAVTDRPRELLIKSNQYESDKVLVAVQDTGIGLDPESMERLFEAFYTTKPEGMGMGLSISRSIIEAHGGRLWNTPNDGPGATFQFTLPMLSEEEGS